MKAVLFPIAILSSLTLVTACGGGKSSSSSKPSSSTYAQKNKDRCITEQSKINKLFGYKKDVVISDGCLEKTSTEKELTFLTDVGLSMRIDFDESESVIETEGNLESVYKSENIELTGLSLKQFKENAKVSIETAHVENQLKFKKAKNQPSYDIELIAPTTKGTYKGFEETVTIEFSVNGKQDSELLENELMAKIIVK